MAGLVVGGGCCSFLFGLAAVLFGHRALQDIKRSEGAIRGWGLAMWGLVLGYIVLVGIPLFYYVVGRLEQGVM